MIRWSFSKVSIGIQDQFSCFSFAFVFAFVYILQFPILRICLARFSIFETCMSRIRLGFTLRKLLRFQGALEFHFMSFNARNQLWFFVFTWRVNVIYNDLAYLLYKVYNFIGCLFKTIVCFMFPSIDNAYFWDYLCFYVCTNVVTMEMS